MGTQPSVNTRKNRVSDDGEAIRSKTCFLLSPIGAHNSDIRARANDVRDYVVKPAVEAIGYDVQRADDIADPGMIMQQVVEAIVTAELVVADLTGLNPNVLYELAIRHETGKPVIIIAERGTDVPFDISQARTIFFDHTVLRSVDECKTSIRDQVAAAQSKAYHPDNPIVNAKIMQSWKASGSSDVRRDAVLLQTMNDISAMISRLDSRIRNVEDGEDRSNVTRSLPVNPRLKHELRAILRTLEQRGINYLTHDDLAQALTMSKEGSLGATMFALERSKEILAASNSGEGLDDHQIAASNDLVDDQLKAR